MCELMGNRPEPLESPLTVSLDKQKDCAVHRGGLVKLIGQAALHVHSTLAKFQHTENSFDVLLKLSCETRDCAVIMFVPR
jgi:hypothetical protein